MSFVTFLHGGDLVAVIAFYISSFFTWWFRFSFAQVAYVIIWIGLRGDLVFCFCLRLGRSTINMQTNYDVVGWNNFNQHEYSYYYCFVSLELCFIRVLFIYLYLLSWFGTIAIHFIVVFFKRVQFFFVVFKKKQNPMILFQFNQINSKKNFLKSPSNNNLQRQKKT